MRGDEALRRSYLQCIAPNPPMVTAAPAPRSLPLAIAVFGTLYLVRCIALYLLVHCILFS